MRIGIIIILSTVIVGLSGCVSTKSGSLNAEKKSNYNPLHAHRDCHQKCSKSSKKSSLFKNGFKRTVDYPSIKGLYGKAFIKISGEQYKENTRPYTSLFFSNGIDRVLFGSSAAEGLLNTLYEVKKDWSKVPDNSEKKYEAYKNSLSGFIYVLLNKKSNNTSITINAYGEHFVNSINMKINKKILNLLISNLEKVKVEIGDEYNPCFNKCLTEAKNQSK